MADKSNSPQGGKRGCLCDNGKTYSKECCKGELKNQGVGALVSQGTSLIINTNSSRTITS